MICFSIEKSSLPVFPTALVWFPSAKVTHQLQLIHLAPFGLQLRERCFDTLPLSIISVCCQNKQLFFFVKACHGSSTLKFASTKKPKSAPCEGYDSGFLRILAIFACNELPLFCTSYLSKNFQTQGRWWNFSKPLKLTYAYWLNEACHRPPECQNAASRFGTGMLSCKVSEENCNTLKSKRQTIIITACCSPHLHLTVNTNKNKHKDYQHISLNI